MGAWEEMEEFQNSSSTSVSTVCWLGQLTFGFMAGEVTGFFALLMNAGDVMLRLFISFGASFGIFSSSSGGGNPCLFSSGGGLIAWLLIFFSAFTGLSLVDAVVPLKSTSVTSSSAIAAGVGCIVGGFASSAASRVSEEVRKRKKGRRKGAADVELAVGGGGGGGCQGECCSGGLNVSNRDLMILSRKKLITLVAAAGREDLENAEVVTRTLAVVFICGGLRLAYAISEAME
ncbi:hypothetical protein TrCOL_g9151 [Triparma columacea]|uniref:Uncharacterized protein n=1 Tax=Triparma columacea TaxID=722753 RepID=A0A9W7LEL2_9STRA|nr:hypothetical protein TrCOL_g9151 [Triparma columacea]